jgi:hypothetical protein
LLVLTGIDDGNIGGAGTVLESGTLKQVRDVWFNTPETRDVRRRSKA